MLPARREEIEDSGQCTVGLNTVWVWQEAMLAHVIVVCIMSFGCVCVCGGNYDNNWQQKLVKRMWVGL